MIKTVFSCTKENILMEHQINDNDNELNEKEVYWK